MTTSKSVWGAALFMLLALPFAIADEKGHPKDDPNVKERIELVLVERWELFRDGDLNKDGFMDEQEFHAHPAYKAAKWGLNIRTFIFWMVDDNKDSRISLQEWFNNELGQFQLADKNHDGIIDAAEYAAIGSVQKKLFSDLGYAP